MQYLLIGLINFIRPFFTTLFAFFGRNLLIAFFAIIKPLWDAILKWFSKLPIYLAWLFIFYGLYSVFVAALSLLVATFMPAIPDFITQASGWFLPSNTFECLTLVYGSKLGRFAYDHQVAALKIKILSQT